MIERTQGQRSILTWGDLLARRRAVFERHPFVGRRYEQEQFRLNYLYKVPQVLLYVLQGPAGIGKTALLNRYREIADEHSGLTAFVTRRRLTLPGEFAMLQIMETLADQLAAANTPLTSFREVQREYLQAVQTMDADPAAPGRVWDVFGGVSDPDSWAQRAWDAYFTRTLPLRQASLVRDPVGALTERFVQDLNAWAVVRQITLCFDDWQPSEIPGISGLPENSPEAWLSALLCNGEFSTNIWFIVTTRAPLGSQWAPLKPVTRTFELQPLPPEEGVTLLETAPAQRAWSPAGVARSNGHNQLPLSEALVQVTLEQAKGNPLSLSLLAGRPQESSQTGSPCEAFCLEAYLDGLKPVQQAALLKCSAARRIDEGVLAVMLGEEAAREIRPWLTASPVLTEVEGATYVRTPLRDPLRQLARARIGPAWEAAHETLFAYYRQRSELGGAGSRYLNQQWRQDQLEALYHELVDGNEGRSLQHVLLAFLDGVQHFSPWAGAVALTWLDAVHTRALASHPTAGSRIADSVHRAWSALVERRWEEALALVDGILSSDELAPPAVTQESLERLRALRNLIASRLVLPPGEEDANHDTETTPTSATKPALGSIRSAASFDQGADSEAPETSSQRASHEPDLGIRTVATVEQPALTDAASAQAEPDQLSDSCEAGDRPAVSDNGDSDINQAEAVDLCNQANAHLSQRDYEAAIRGYDEAISRNPHYVAAYYNRGVAYTRMGALDGAITDFTHVLELDPQQLQAHRQRGLIYTRKGDYARAIADYDAALAAMGGESAADGSQADALIYDRANASFHLKWYEQAIAGYTAVLERTPDHLEAYLNRGLAHAANDNYPEALRDFNQAIALDPDHAPSYHHRGRIYVHTGRYTEALHDYERALELDPRYAAVHNNRGLLYVKIEAYAEAVEAYQRAMALQPDWATPYYNAACAAALMHDTDQACVWLARAIALREAYRAIALRDPDLAPLRDDPKFQTLVQAPARR